ncbi:MAG: hypothetical protein R2822_13430 [Spirosomataceae bacterium]
MVTLETSNSFIELEPQKFFGLLKEDGLDNALDYRKRNGETQKNGRELYRRCAKTILQIGEERSTKITQSTGMTLEIILFKAYFLPEEVHSLVSFYTKAKP